MRLSRSVGRLVGNQASMALAYKGIAHHAYTVHMLLVQVISVCGIRIKPSPVSEHGISETKRNAIERPMCGIEIKANAAARPMHKTMQNKYIIVFATWTELVM